MESSTRVFGDALQSEKVAQENKVCREMVKEMMDYGLNQRQLLFMIYLLGLELHNIDDMRSVTNLIKQIDAGIHLVDES